MYGMNNKGGGKKINEKFLWEFCFSKDTMNDIILFRRRHNCDASQSITTTTKTKKK